jgi:hypothetical protein
VERLLSAAVKGVGPFKSADVVARKAMSGDRTPRQAVNSLVRIHVAMAGAQGFVTNLGGVMASLVALPADVGATALIQMRLAAAIARVHGHDLGDEEVRAKIIGCLPASNVVQVLKKAGIQMGRAKLAASATTRDSGVLRKGGPLIGGAIGGGLDAVSTKLVGVLARRTFSPDDVETDPADDGVVGDVVPGGRVRARLARGPGPLRRFGSRRPVLAVDVGEFGVVGPVATSDSQQHVVPL